MARQVLLAQFLKDQESEEQSYGEPSPKSYAQSDTRNNCIAASRARTKASTSQERIDLRQMAFDSLLHLFRPAMVSYNPYAYVIPQVSLLTNCILFHSIMQIYLIYYSIARYLGSRASAATAKLDLSPGSATISLVMFIPGVTLGLLIFIVFGSTGPFRRDYARWARSFVSCILGRRSTRNSLASGSLHRTESVVRLTNLEHKSSDRSGGNEEAGLVGKGPDGEYRVSVTPIAGEEGDYEERQMGMGILMTRVVKQSDGR
jgi:hypothetical protein